MNIVFQFHNGTIKTAGTVDEFMVDELFQFHNGTIKTLLSCECFPLQIHFNSIMVQLKHGGKEYTQRYCL